MKTRHQHLAAFGSGLVFALGLTVSGMTDPSKVIGFLDVFGAWDPSLAFVMIGAIGVHLFAYRLAVRRASPLYAQAFQLPSVRTIDKKLVIGAGLFGLGWGLGGFCPGPALTSLVTLSPGVLVFAGGMLAGMLAHTLWSRPKAPAEVAVEPQAPEVEAA